MSTDHDIEKLAATLDRERKDRTVADLTTHLVARGIDAFVARLMADQESVRQRLRFSDSGHLTVTEADSAKPLAGEDPLDALAKELVEEAPAKFGGAGHSATLYDDIRAEVRRDNERRAGRSA